MVIVIVGPTAVGKTKLSIELAKKLNGEVINADSTQVYKGLDIATAKATKEEMEDIVHHLIDIKDITQNYTVYDYQQDARIKIKDILSRGKIPILVGGTGLYIKAALYDYELEEEKSVEDIYSHWETEKLYERLLQVDPNTNIHPHNRQRIIRSLEYYDIHKKPLSDKKPSNQLLYDTVFIGLTTQREVLYEKINKRTHLMLEEGLLEEAKEIFDSNIRTKAVMTPIGYKELFPYFEKKKSLEECLEDIKKSCRHYAKRQYTWFRHQMDINWFETNYDNFNKTVEEVEKYIKQWSI